MIYRSRQNIVALPTYFLHCCSVQKNTIRKANTKTLNQLLFFYRHSLPPTRNKLINERIAIRPKKKGCLNKKMYIDVEAHEFSSFDWWTDVWQCLSLRIVLRRKSPSGFLGIQISVVFEIWHISMIGCSDVTKEYTYKRKNVARNSNRTRCRHHRSVPTINGSPNIYDSR